MRHTDSAHTQFRSDRKKNWHTLITQSGLMPSLQMGTGH